MTLGEFENQLKILLDKYYKNREDYAVSEKIETLFDDFLGEHSQNTDIWLKYALFEYYNHDDYKALDLLKEVLNYDPNNVYATLLLAYLSFTYSFKYKEYAFDKLHELKVNNLELLSMIEYVKALYYSLLENNVKCEEHLKKSIEYWDKHVLNNYHLGTYYIEQGKIVEGKKLIEKALQNVQHIYYYPPKKEETQEEYLSVEKFINEHIKGTYITYSNYNFKKEVLDKIKS